MLTSLLFLLVIIPIIYLFIYILAIIAFCEGYRNITEMLQKILGL